jgi:hypothetical protein
MTSTLVLVVAALAAATLWRIQLAHVRRLRHERRQLFAEVHGVLDEVRVHGDGAYPTLIGTYRGYQVRLEPVVDTLGLRKLPSLWLVVTQQRRLDLDVPVDVLVRPSGTEYFSPNAGFAHELGPPDGFPAHVRVASPGPGPTAGSIECLAPLVCDPRTKDVLVSANGVRVVRMLAEAAQGPYRTARTAEFGVVRIAPDGLRRLLDVVTGVGDALAADPVRAD